MKFLNLKHYFLGIISTFALLSCQSKATISGNINFSTPSFTGVSLVSNNNNGTYTVSWEAAANVTSATYQIFSREVVPISLLQKFKNLFLASSSDYFSTPIATVTNQTSWTSDLLAFKYNTCFVVRAVAKKLKDTNFVELCTNHTKYSFAGLTSIANNNDGTFSLSWTAVPYVISNYNVYQRAEASGTYDFTSPTFAALTNTSLTSGIISTMPSQCFVVRASSTSQAFTDINTNEICTKHTQVIFADISNITHVSGIRRIFHLRFA